MKFVKWSEKNWDDKVGYSKKILLSDLDIWTKWVHVQEVKIKAHEVAKAHYHKIQTEMFYFLTDNWYRIVNWEKIQPKVWDVLMIKPDDVHEVVNETDTDYIYLAFKTDYAQDDLIWC